MHAIRIPWRAWTGLFLLTIGCLRVSAQESNARASTEYPAFKIIPDRNIFNANRSRSRSATEKPRVVESFTLKGTLSYEKGVFAIVEGTSSEYSKILKPADKIAGYTVAAITHKHVKLEADGKAVELPVGMQMRKEEAGEWQVAEYDETSSSSNRSSSSEFRPGRNGPDFRAGRGGGLDPRSNRRGNADGGSGRRSSSESGAGRTTTSSETSSDTPAADASEVLKRLMQQREQETKK